MKKNRKMRKERRWRRRGGDGGEGEGWRALRTGLRGEIEDEKGVGEGINDKI